MKLSLYPCRRCYATLFALLACALLVAAPARADPPGRIGRLAWLAGTVSLQSASGDAFSAALNQPLTSGDILTVAPNSRAEIEIGSKTVRLDADSMLELERIDDEAVRLFLSQGRAIAVLPTPEAFADFEMATINGQFKASEPGIYRFGADSNGSSATVYAGRLHFAGQGSALDLRAGVAAQFWQDGPSRFRLMTPAKDEFSEWSAARDQRAAAYANAPNARYVSPEMTGAADLDAYGNWSETPEYGPIWYPRSVAADWAPYRSGNWVWVAPWGWTWVGYEPWGFAPFHYGRWVQHHGHWGWVPGTRIARPVYAPAMVAWIGSPGVGIAIGSRPTVGWFPLAPHEVYVPSYRSSEHYVRQINVTHVAKLTEATLIVRDPQAFVARTHYAHRELPQAVTVVPAEVVTQRRPVAPAALAPGDRRALREQPLQAAAPLAAPAAPPARPSPQFGRHERQESFGATPGGTVNRSAANPAAPAAIGAVPRSEPGAPGQPAPVARPETFTPRAGGVPPIGGERQQVALPPASVSTAPKSEPPRPEIVRPAPVQRAEPHEARQSDRSFRQVEIAPQRAPQAVPQATPQTAQQAAPQAMPQFAPRQPQREARIEAPPAQLHQAPAAAPEVRHEARPIGSAPPARVEARSPAEADRQRAPGKEDHRHHDENEKR